ncbi:MAG: hypothetical protein AAB869_01850 [Patescibacteria group bacterium]
MLTTGTRFFGKDPAKDLPRLAKFLDAAQKLGKVFVAVNTVEDKCDTLAFCAQSYPAVDAFAVTPWQKFVAPLNAIVYRATLTGADRLLLASAEFSPEAHQVDALLAHVDDATLVSGARFSEHAFTEGEVIGTGVTVPWNTFAVWNLCHLVKLGVPLVGDAPFDQKQAGVEEVATIALYQRVFGLKAKLVSVPGFYEEWNTAGWDEERLRKHQAKIASKVSRPEAQLKWAGLSAPIILHIA